jgi:hypothetical protein
MDCWSIPVQQQIEAQGQAAFEASQAGVEAMRHHHRLQGQHT